jgi:drug/metabolite transporter (DMT)-like permease
MNWLPYAVLTSIALAAADVFVKLASGKISNSIGILIYGGCTFLIGALWVAWERLRGDEQFAQLNGILPAVGVGIAFALVTIGLYATFGAGAPISIASPIVRLAGLLIASAVGILFFHEAITWRYALGALLTIAGIYFILTR